MFVDALRSRSSKPATGHVMVSLLLGLCSAVQPALAVPQAQVPANRNRHPTDNTARADETASSPFEGLVFFCTKCKKEVPEALGAGATCPHCGAYFRTATNADGTDSMVEPPSSGVPVRIWGPVLLALIFGAEYGYRRWRRRSKIRD